MCAFVLSSNHTEHLWLIVVFLPQVRAVGETSRREHGRPEVWRSEDLQRLFDTTYHVLVGPDKLAARTNNCSLNTKCRQDGH